MFKESKSRHTWTPQTSTQYSTVQPIRLTGYSKQFNNGSNNNNIMNISGINLYVVPNFKRNGIVNSHQILGEYLFLNKDQILFTEWLRTFGMNNNECIQCYNNIREQWLLLCT